MNHGLHKDPTRKAKIDHLEVTQFTSVHRLGIHASFISSRWVAPEDHIVHLHISVSNASKMEVVHRPHHLGRFVHFGVRTRQAIKGLPTSLHSRPTILGSHLHNDARDGESVRVQVDAHQADNVRMFIDQLIQKVIAAVVIFYSNPSR